MGEVATRVAAGVITGGISEIGQKKPFQDVGHDNPIGGASASPLRFIPGAGSLLAAADVGLGALSKKGLSVPQSPLPITTQTAAVQQAASEAAQRRSRARGFQSTILSSLTQSGGGSSAPRTTIGS